VDPRTGDAHPYAGDVWMIAGLVNTFVDGGRTMRMGAVAHRPDCRYCNDGRGKAEKVGKPVAEWHRFENLRAAKAWATAEGYLNQRMCRSCRPE